MLRQGRDTQAKVMEKKVTLKCFPLLHLPLVRQAFKMSGLELHSETLKTD